MTKEELLAWRNGRGLTRQQLADSLGVSSWTVVKWERGERKIPAFMWRALEHLDCATRRLKPVPIIAPHLKMENENRSEGG